MFKQTARRTFQFPLFLTRSNNPNKTHSFTFHRHVANSSYFANHFIFSASESSSSPCQVHTCQRVTRQSIQYFISRTSRLLFYDFNYFHCGSGDSDQPLNRSRVLCDREYVLRTRADQLWMCRSPSICLQDRNKARIRTKSKY